MAAKTVKIKTQKIQFKFLGLDFSLRVSTPQELVPHTKEVYIPILVEQSLELNNLLWLGMVALARDLYSHTKSKSSGTAPTIYFQNLIESLGLQLTLADGTTVDMAKVLKA